MFENYRGSLFNDKIKVKSQQRFKRDCHEVQTEETNKIVLSTNDDKRLQTIDKITTYLYGIEEEANATFQEVININDKF